MIEKYTWLKDKTISDIQQLKNAEETFKKLNLSTLHFIRSLTKEEDEYAKKIYEIFDGFLKRCGTSPLDYPESIQNCIYMLKREWEKPKNFFSWGTDKSQNENKRETRNYSFFNDHQKMENDYNGEKTDFKPVLSAYQYELMLLFLWRGQKSGCFDKCELGLELKEDKRFDDVIIFYERNGYTRICYVQAECSRQAVEYRDFESKWSEAVCNLRKYFVSYRKVTQRTYQHKIKDMIVCTNASFEKLTLRKNAINMLTFEDESAKRYDQIFDGMKKHQLKDINTADKLLKKLKRCTNLNLLAKELVTSIFKSQEEAILDLQNYWISAYFDALIFEKVIEEQEYYKFSQTDDSLKSNNEIQEFKNSFIEKRVKFDGIKNENTRFDKAYIDQLIQNEGSSSATNEEIVEILVQHITANENPQMHKTFEKLKTLLTYEKSYFFTNAFIYNSNDLFVNAKEFRKLLMKACEKEIMKKLEENQVFAEDALNGIQYASAITTANQDEREEKMAKELVEHIFYKKELLNIFDPDYAFLKDVFDLSGMNTLKFAKDFVTNACQKSFRKKLMMFYTQEKLKNTTIKFKQDLSKYFVIIDQLKRSYDDSETKATKILKLDRRYWKKRNMEGLIESLNGSIFIATTESDEIKFKDIFTNSSERILSKLAKEFKQNLKDKFKNQFLKLKDYKIEYINFPPFYDELKEENVDINVDIENFCKKLVIVQSPNEKDLTIEVEREMGDKFHLFNKFKKTINQFQEVLEEAKGKEENPLHKRDAKVFMDITEKNLLTECTVQYSNKIEKYFVSYNDIYNDLIKFLGLPPFTANENKVLHIQTNETLLTTIQINQTLNSFSCFKNKDFFIFCPLTTLLRMENDEKHVSKAFDSTTDLLIIVEKNVHDNLHEFCETISGILCKPNKKIVVIANEESQIISYLKPHKNETKTHRVTFNDLTEISQQMIRQNAIISFQGYELSLNSFLDEEEISELIDPHTLQQMIVGKKIKIGQSLENFTENDYYVQRKIRLIEVKDSLFSEKSLPPKHLFAIEGMETETFLKTKNVHERLINAYDLLSKDADINKVFILLEKPQAEKQFQQICEKFPGHCIHWLKYGSNKLLWFHSYVPSSFILSKEFAGYISRENEYVSESFFGEYVEKNKVVIIADSAGTGKSTILKSFSKILKKDEQWIIRINLNNYTKELNKIKKIAFRNNEKLFLNFDQFDNEKKDYAKLVFESLITNEFDINKMLTFENRIFHYFFTERGMLFMFDGFDEINPTYGEVVLKLFHMLRKNGNNRIWITSRANFKEKLEKEFNTFAYDLKPFDRNDQEIFLKQYWIRNYKRCKGTDMPNQDRLSYYIKKSLDEALCRFNDITGIPLQTKILAEGFQENHDDNEGKNKWISCFEYIESEIPQDNLNISTKFGNVFLYYENFFKEKVSIYFLQEKGIVGLSKPFARNIGKDVLFVEYSVHKIFGYLALTDQSKNEILLTESEKRIKNKWLMDFRQGTERLGIINSFNAENHPLFNHFTYAEYFAACFLADKLCDSSNNCKKVFEIIDEILKKDVPVFVECFKYKLKQEINNDQLKEGLKGKSVLQFVIERGFVNCINVFMQSNDFNHEFPFGDEFGKTVLHYAAECNNLDGVIYLAFWVYKLLGDIDLFLNYLSNSFFKNDNTIIYDVNLKCFFDDLKAAVEQHVKYKIEDDIRKNICGLQDKNETRVSNAFLYVENDTEMKNEFLNLFSVHSIKMILDCLLFNNVNTDLIIRFTQNLCSRSDIKVDEKIQIFKRILKVYNDDYSVEDEKKIIYIIIQNDCENILDHILTNGDFKIAKMEYILYSIACQSDAFQAIKKLLQHSKNPNTVFLHPLDDAVRNKTRIETVKILYENTDASTYDKYLMGRTALHIAVENECNIKTIEFLVEKGFDPNKKSFFGDSAWMKAVKTANDDAIKYFLSKFDNLEYNYMVKILKEYYENPENFNVNQEFEGRPLLHYAAAKENVALCSFLIFKGANIYENSLKEKPILDHTFTEKLSSLFDKDDFMKKNLLMRNRLERLMRKLEVNLKYKNGNTKLHLAAQNDDGKKIIDLLKQGAYYNIKNEKGETPKDVAKFEQKALFTEIDQFFIDARNNNFDFVEKYEKFSYVYSAKDENGKTLLHYAVMKNNLEAVKSLIRMSNEDLNDKDSDKKAPIYYAVKNNNKEMLKIMLKREPIDFSTLCNTKAYKEIEENDCKTLISSIKKCTDYAFNEDLNELNNELGLIKNNKDFNFIVNVKPLGRLSIMDYAKRYPDISLDLLQKGIVVQQLNFINNKTERLLFILIQIAKYVLSKKFEPESIIKYFNNTFMEALSYCTNDSSVADKIISNARFDFENIHGATLLHIAAISDEAEIAQWLIDEKHADPFAKDHNDNDVYTLAEKNNAQKVLSVLPPKSK